jgi:branched-chain amino acid transport system ATP-binding protein
MSLLSMRKAVVGYGELAVISDIDLEVGPGEIVALLGRNGAGKTTILNTISGLIPSLGGTVEVLGTPVDPRRPHLNARRGVGHVPEGRSLFTQMSVNENLWAAAANKEDYNEAIKTFPILTELMSRKVGLLSGGEQQMLAIGRALVGKPKLLLIDELSLGLAPMVAKSIHIKLKEIVADTGIGVLLVEQYVHLGLDTADRAYVVGTNAITMEGKASDMRGRIDEVEAAYLGASTP